MGHLGFVIAKYDFFLPFGLSDRGLKHVFGGVLIGGAHGSTQRNILSVYIHRICPF